MSERKVLREITPNGVRVYGHWYGFDGMEIFKGFPVEILFEPGVEANGDRLVGIFDGEAVELRQRAEHPNDPGLGNLTEREEVAEAARIAGQLAGLTVGQALHVLKIAGGLIRQTARFTAADSRELIEEFQAVSRESSEQLHR